MQFRKEISRILLWAEAFSVYFHLIPLIYDIVLKTTVNNSQERKKIAMKEKMRLGLAGWAALILLIGITLSACGADTTALQPADTPEVEQAAPTTASEQTVEPAAPTAAQKQAEAPTDPPAVPTANVSGNTIPMPELGFELGDPALKATNPKVFTKAAGRPQVIELFAFW
jgi:hypothetical protein